MAGRLEDTVQEDETQEPQFSYNLELFIKGSLSVTTELIQTKRDLGRTKLAERIAKQRRALKNTQLKSGGRLMVDDGRQMLVRKEEDEVAKARKVVEAAELRARNAQKRCFEDAAKEARRWRSIGKLNRAEVYDSNLRSRLSKRF